MQDEMTMIAIPTGLYRRVVSALPHVEQTSVETFVVHAVRTALATVEAAVAATSEDDTVIVERLRKLGYID
jgi:hypothetical protein